MENKTVSHKASSGIYAYNKAAGSTAPKDQKSSGQSSLGTSSILRENSRTSLDWLLSRARDSLHGIYGNVKEYGLIKVNLKTALLILYGFTRGCFLEFVSRIMTTARNLPEG